MAIHGEGPASAHLPTGFIGAWGRSPVQPAIHQLANGGVDVNGNGKDTDAFYNASAQLGDKSSVQRKRLGINASLQGDLGSGFTLTADGFFTRLNSWNRNVRWEIYSATEEGATFVPLTTRDTGLKITPTGVSDTPAHQKEFYTTQVYKKWPGDIETFTLTNVKHSIARNFNLQLNYNHGGPFTGNLRLINGNAESNSIGAYIQFSDATGNQWSGTPADDTLPAGVFNYPSGPRPFNANGVPANSVPMTYDMRGTDMSVMSPSGFQKFLANPDSYQPKTFASDGTRGTDFSRSTNMDIVRANGHYHFGFVDPTFGELKLDFGLRNSIRTAANVTYRLISPLYAGKGASDPNGCQVVWKAADVIMNGGGIAGACTASNAQGYFHGDIYSGLPRSQWPGILKNNFRYYPELGNVQGMGVWAEDPKALDDPLAFMNALSPGETRSPNPGTTWALTFHEESAFIQADWDGMIGNVTFKGNAGVRAIRSTLHVSQAVNGAPQPYGKEPLTNGLVTTDREWTDILPAVNMTFGFTHNLLLRFAYSKNMMPLSLSTWGGGLTVGYAINTTTGLFIAESATSAGNPDLKPWRSTNYNLSLEYYMGPSSLIDLEAFYIKVAKFIKNGSVLNCHIPDLNGKVSGRCVPVTGPIQGSGQALHGLEFSYQQALKFLPGFLSHTGIDFNFTYSPSNTGKQDLAGRDIPFQDNSKETSNLILWYENSKFQARLAWNYRSRRAVSSNYGGIKGFELYQAPQQYIDASVQYNVTPKIEIFLQGENLTGEHERFYLVWPDQVAQTVHFDRRYKLGVRVHF